MLSTSFRQISAIVENGLLSHLTNDALRENIERLRAAQDGKAAEQFPGEACSAADVEKFAAAFADEAAARGLSDLA